MNIVKLFGMLLVIGCGVPVSAQQNVSVPGVNVEEAPAVNSFFERGPVKDYQLKTIYVGGEVANPGPVELASLPVREVAVRELAFADGAPQFKGSFFFSGYTLYDILKAKTVKKAAGDFRPEVDLYVVVENDKGEKAVFSWGEIYYARNSFNALIYSSARSVTTGRKKDWPLPAVSRLVCADDMYDTRFITAPTRITVKSAPGTYPGTKHAAAPSASFVIKAGEKTLTVSEPAKGSPKRGYISTGYGHGTGYKGVKAAEGFLFKDTLAAAGILPQDSGTVLVIVSAGDAYRAAFSLSEIVNRADNSDFLLEDRGQAEGGRFALYSATDFFVDRNVTSIAKVELLKL